MSKRDAEIYREAAERILHIYAQKVWHDDACIVGERDQLESLRDAITRALETGRGKMQAFVNDGEGYDVHVICVDVDQAEKLHAPYIDYIAADHEGTVLWPWEIK